MDIKLRKQIKNGLETGDNTVIVYVTWTSLQPNLQIHI